ncbi:3-hydroxyisobutyrate dehydrogenase [Tsukamurella asaccharolytica]|uniref:Probable 3-hydroxyisobutyrate dehydrogenase n=1 Tax=Tsukamurella asaccharolytica TaxID=2592067 RepID=A0A5C5RFL9_9ACTN|nr:3-hydroxyisobutyrate dehydrogenase [Tsukamurella asaccharolytica]TWS21364.1 3-hydroxyisobutyrate dehydrogenase [Tsukamurella asaccharolytica]
MATINPTEGNVVAGDQRPEETIGFIGMGHMGLPMAANLVRAGRHVLGFDLVPAARVRAAEAGIRVVDAVTDAADASTVITMLPSGAHVHDAYASGLLDAARPGTMFLDCSTISVADAARAHDLAVAAGHRSVDAPVSGGVGGAEAGTLSFMVGGDPADHAAVSPLLSEMGAKIFHCGPPGSGQAAKICNNMILGVSMLAVSEAFVLAEKLGLAHQAMFDVVASSSGACWSLTSYCPVPGPVPTSPANHDYRPGFATALMAKDLSLAAEAVRANDVDGPVGLLAEEIYRRYRDEFGGGDDFSAIVTDIRARSAGDS